MVSRTNQYCSMMIRNNPAAAAIIHGSAEFPDIDGIALFYDTPYGVATSVEVIGLPHGDEKCNARIFGCHIHEGDVCVGNARNPFVDVGLHYNPYDCPHPHHSGDLPPLFENNGYAWYVTITGRFTINNIIGKTIIIHRNPDDFTTQPGGNSGDMIACGEIIKTSASVMRHMQNIRKRFI